MATIWIALFLAGCNSEQLPVQEFSTRFETIAVVNTAQSFTQIPEIVSATNLAVATLLSVTPLTTEFITSIHTISNSTPAFTPILSTQDSQSEVLNLLETNGDCLFPCWWGLSPGETSADDAKYFVEKFGNISQGTILDDNGGYLNLSMQQDSLLITPRFEYNLTTDKDYLDRLKATVAIVRQTEEGGFEYAFDDPLFTQLLMPYSVSKVLSTYGKPSEVLVFVNRKGREFELLLTYPEIGFLINYHALLENGGETYTGCLSKAYVVLLAWDPEHNHSSIEEAASVFYGERFSNDWIAQFLPVETATNLSVDKFIALFLNRNGSDCLNSPVSLWPEQ